jgi:AcrR family transcriptional regulator
VNTITRRPGLSKTIIAREAVALVNEQGIDSLSVGTLARRLDVKPPSLYNHIDGLADLKRVMMLQGLQELGTRLGQAAVGRSGFHALRDVAHAYRTFAKEQPAVYLLTLEAPPSQDDDYQKIVREVLDIVLAVFRGYELEPDQAIHAVRCFRSALHGFVSLELAGGFGLPFDVDESFERLITLLDQGIRQL